MMLNDMEGLPPEYEEMINKLSDQINELFSKLHYYQGLVAEKEVKITQLNKVNTLLKSQVRDLTQILKAPPLSSQKSYLPPAPKRQVASARISSEGIRINKRVCPECGATGFAIREVDDKSKILTYRPRRIYAKKKICTKCRLEFSN